ncbi:hypothetical protein [Aquimarina sp. 2201CG5-10]|uniref:hypothetical protein n=1 Tax=Aquimarina callyspongiae TaxID=3098150 RepID=UPI002AB35CF8|nr:hypothetical protein [Aquimarina sp. 2201CG5-10]MDY8137221.1 hypothetical protein [Aquimarina sp. 2201CG5-10]
MNLLKISFFLVLISCSTFSKKEQILTEDENIKLNDQDTEVEKVKITNYNFVAHFYDKSYGSILINGIPIVYRSLEDTKSSSRSNSLPIGDLLVNGTNTIQLIGDFQEDKYEIGVYQNEVIQSGQLADEDIKIELKKSNSNFFTFDINNIPYHIWDDGEDFKASDYENLATLVKRMDHIIKKGQVKKYIELHKIEIQEAVKRINSIGHLSFSFKEMEDDLKDSFKTIRKGKEFTAIDISIDEIKYHISTSKKLATITHKNKPYLTGFRDNEFPKQVWEWKMLYMKKNGKFIPILDY